MRDCRNVELSAIQTALMAEHEAAHAIIAAVAGFTVCSVSLRRTKDRFGVCKSEGLSVWLYPWDIDHFSPRDETTGLRKTDKGRLKFCLSAIRRVRNVTKAEMLRLIRAQLCVCLAGHATDMGGTYEPQKPYPKDDDFDHVSAYMQWLLLLGDKTTINQLEDYVTDALDSFEEQRLQITAALLDKKRLTRRELKKFLPQPWANWPPLPSP